MDPVRLSGVFLGSTLRNPRPQRSHTPVGRWRELSQITVPTVPNPGPIPFAPPLCPPSRRTGDEVMVVCPMPCRLSGNFFFNLLILGCSSPRLLSRLHGTGRATRRPPLRSDLSRGELPTLSHC